MARGTSFHCLAQSTYQFSTSKDNVQYGRALLDSGSQLNFVSKKFVSQCGLKVQPSSCTIFTIGAEHASVTLGSVCFQVAMPGGDRQPVFAQILTKVANVMPAQPIDITQADPRHIQGDLADPTFTQPGEIDLLIGVEVYEQVMIGVKFRMGMLTATSSQFGWVITGTAMVCQKEGCGDKPQDSFSVCFSALTERVSTAIQEVHGGSCSTVRHAPVYPPKLRLVDVHNQINMKMVGDGPILMCLPSSKLRVGESLLQLERSNGFPNAGTTVGHETLSIQEPSFKVTNAPRQPTR